MIRKLPQKGSFFIKKFHLLFITYYLKKSYLCGLEEILKK